MHQRTWVLATVLTTIGAMAPQPAAMAADPIERLTAFAVDLGATVRPNATTVDIAIERWTTPKEQAMLTAALREGGTDDLLEALRKIEPPAGYIRSGTSLGYPLRMAVQIPLPDGGRRILIATDRRISFLELRNRPITVDEYPFMVIDMRLDAKGEGQGKLLPVAKIRFNENHVLEVENYEAQPVRLTKVQKVG